MTRRTVVEQALALADADGLDAVTFRRLAEQLGVTPMALYWHVKNKDELLAAMSDQLLAEVRPHRDPDQPWQVQLRTMAMSLTRVMRAHPSAPTLLAAADKSEVEGLTRATETALALLRQAGFTLQEGFLIAKHLMHSAIGLVAQHPDCTPGTTDEERRQHKLALQALPADLYPNIVRCAAEEDLDPDAYIEFGIDLLMAGIEAMAGQRTASL